MSRRIYTSTNTEPCLLDKVGVRMLPQGLTGTYLRYKEDTKDVATWLVLNAEACGYKSPVTPLLAVPTFHF